MADRDRRHITNKPHRSFVVRDFAVRDIPFALLAFFIICVASVVLGLVVESFSSLWRGCVLGIVITILAMEVLRQIPGIRLNENREASMSITKRTRLTFSQAAVSPSWASSSDSRRSLSPHNGWEAGQRSTKQPVINSSRTRES